MPTVFRSGSDEITAEGSKDLPSPTCTRMQRSPSNSSFVTRWLSSTLPPSSSMSAVICSHIWPGP